MRYRGVTGPIILITVGVLFAMEYIWGMWEFSRTWPVILVVIGVVKLVERLAYDSHGPQPRPWGAAAPPPPPARPPPPTYNMPPQPPGTAPGVVTNSGPGDASNA